MSMIGPSFPHRVAMPRSICLRGRAMAGLRQVSCVGALERRGLQEEWNGVAPSRSGRRRLRASTPDSGHLPPATGARWLPGLQIAVGFRERGLWPYEAVVLGFL